MLLVFEIHFFPMALLILRATWSSMTLNGNFSGMEPGTAIIVSSPSHVLQIHPLWFNGLKFHY